MACGNLSKMSWRVQCCQAAQNQKVLADRQSPEVYHEVLRAEANCRGKGLESDNRRKIWPGKTLRRSRSSTKLSHQAFKKSVVSPRGCR